MSGTIEKITSLEETILELLCCPVCLAYVRPPIRMCVNSHVTCNECLQRLDSCPTCRGDKGIGRAFLLEQIYETMDIPCKYDGCSFKGRGALGQKHELSCNFVPIVCPLRLEYKCFWNGTVHSLPDHLREVHPQNVFFETPQKLQVKDFANELYKDVEYYLLFCVLGKVFMLCWKYTVNLWGVVRFSMSEIGNSNHEKSDKYQFALYFSSDLNAEDSDVNCMHLSAGVSSEDSMKEGRFMNGNFFTLRHTWLLDVCDRKGHLNYKVVIRKIEKPSENDTYCKIWKSGNDIPCTRYTT